jgi:hypothetical protein
MTVDLNDLVDPLKNRVNPPGTDLFPDATDDTWFLSLQNAFWDVRLHGMLASWEENAAARGGPAAFAEGIITPIGQTDDTYDDATGFDTNTDMGREFQQLVVVWAAWRTTLTQFQNVRAKFRAKAGPVEFEEEQSASILKTILDQLRDEIKMILFNLSTYGLGDNAGVLDAVIERSYSMSVRDVWWVR